MLSKTARRSIFIFLAAALAVWAFGIVASAHGDEEDSHDEMAGMAEVGQLEIEVGEEPGATLEDRFRQTSTRLVLLGSAVLVGLVFLSSLAKRKRNAFLMYILFFSIIAIIVGITAYVAGSTVYLNVVSKTGGPVHWHADYQVWSCGERLTLQSPEGLSNKIGSNTLHAHADDRMHVEGVVVDYNDVDVGAYFAAVGGSLTGNSFSYLTDKEMVVRSNGNQCPGGQSGELKVYVNGKRIRDPANYVLSPYSVVPPGDCIIVDFSPGSASTTEQMCESWEAHGSTYKEAREQFKEHAMEQEEHMDDEEHVEGSQRFGSLATFGPGEAPHHHATDVTTLEKVADIARAASDLPPPLARKYPETVKVTLVAKEVVSEIAPGITFAYWTFNGTVPGPFLRVREGDTVELTLYNDESSTHNHSIDLHAVTGPGGGAVLTQVEPGGRKTIRFKALNPGLYVYHCATPNVPKHMANGMYGLILVEPKEGLPAVDREFYVMQGELYTEGALGEPGFQEFDPAKMRNEDPEYVVFNGRVKGLVDSPLAAKVGETVRLYVGNGGVSLISSFHVIGEIFDTVYPEGATSVIRNVQSTIVPAGGSTMTDFALEVPGSFVLVDHALSRLDRGAWGILKVSGEENPEVFAGIGSGKGDGHGG